MEDEYELDEGISLGAIFKVGFGRKLLFLIVTLAVAVVVFLAIVLFYNKSKVNYESSFAYDTVSLSDGKYIDGSSYNVNYIISSANLLAVKESNEEFKNIDVQKIIETNSISLDKNVKEYSNADLKSETTYTLRVLKKFFPNDKVAAAFVKAVAETPITKTNALAASLTYDGNLAAYTTADAYETKISLLESQKTFLTESYDKLIELYGDIYINNRSLSSYQREIEDYFKTNQITVLSSQIATYGYVLDFDAHKNDLNIQKEHLTTEIANNTRSIDYIHAEIDRLLQKVKDNAVTSITLELDSYNTELAKLNLENSNYQKELEIVNTKLTNNGGADKTVFENTLKTYYDKLNGYTVEYKNVSKDVYASNETIGYTSSSSIKKVGGLSTVLTIVIGLVLGIVVAFIVNLIVDREKLSPNYVWPTKKQPTKDTEAKENE